MRPEHDVVFLLDFDNTLFDNDRFQADLFGRFAGEFGADGRKRYQTILEGLRAELGYVDYLGALQVFRLAYAEWPALLTMSSFMLNYPFSSLVFPGACEAVLHLRKTGTVAVLSDGDVVFQPWKIRRSGIWQSVVGEVMIKVHKEQVLETVATRYPARRYVVVDDKLPVLDAIKRVWKSRVTTVFVRQGHYALEAAGNAALPPADVSIDTIGLLAQLDFQAPRVRGFASWVHQEKRTGTR